MFQTEPPVGVITADMTLVSGALLGLTINGLQVAAGDGGVLGGGTLGAQFAIRDDLAPQVQTQIEQVVPNRHEVATNLAPLFGLTPEEALEMPIVLVGTVDEICADLVARRETYGLSYVVVHDIDAFAPVVARLAGT